MRQAGRTGASNRIFEQGENPTRALAAFGERLLLGWQAPCSPRDGAALLAEAAEKGDARACLVSSVIAAAGVGRTQSWGDAFKALNQAAELGAPEAAVQLALLRRLGLETPQVATQWIVAVQPRVLGAERRLRQVSEFLPRDLCDYLVGRARPRLVPARVHDAHGRGLQFDPMRTNTGAVFSLLDTDLVMQLFRARAAAAANARRETLEPLEILHYAVGETYRPHVDFVHPRLPTFAEEMRTRGQRVKTCLVYLNDDFSGGETEFPALGIKFRGRKGEALIFDNASANGAGDMDTLHTGLPPTAGEKWLLSQWIRSKPQPVT